MAAGDIVVDGIQHARRTAAVAVRLMVHRIGANLAHQLFGPGERPLQRRTDLFGTVHVDQMGAGMRIAEGYDGFVEEHELQNDRRTVTQHRVGTLQERHLIGSLEKGHVVVFGGDPLVSGDDIGIGQLRMEGDDPVPRLGFGQQLDLLHQMGRRTYIARKGRRIENNGPVVAGPELRFG